MTKVPTPLRLPALPLGLDWDGPKLRGCRPAGASSLVPPPSPPPMLDITAVADAAADAAAASDSDSADSGFDAAPGDSAELGDSAAADPVTADSADVPSSAADANIASAELGDSTAADPVAADSAEAPSPATDPDVATAPGSAADAAAADGSAIADSAADAAATAGSAAASDSAAIDSSVTVADFATAVDFPWPDDNSSHHRQYGFVRFAPFDVVETVGVVHIVRRWRDIEAAANAPIEMHRHPDGTWRLPSHPSDEPHAALVMYQHQDGTCDVRLLNDLGIVVRRACVQFAPFTLDEATRARVREFRDHLASLESAVQRAHRAALGAPANANPVADDPTAAALSDLAADDPAAADSDSAAAAHRDADSAAATGPDTDADSAAAADPNTESAAPAGPDADPAADFADLGDSAATDPVTANLAAAANVDANLTAAADTGPAAYVDAGPVISAADADPVAHADTESVASDDPAAADNTAAGDLAISASSYSVREVGASVTTWSLTDVSASSYSIRDALASATSWSFLERSGSASDSSDQSRSTSRPSVRSAPVRSLIATQPSATPRAAEPPLAPPGWRAILLEDGATMYRNLTSGALSLNAREDCVVPPPPLPTAPSTQLRASRVSRIPRATNLLARWLGDLRPPLPTARSPHVPIALPAASDSTAPALPPQRAADGAQLEDPAPPLPIHPRVADVIQRFRDGRFRHPPDILRPSERGYSLGVAVGLAAMKQRGHQDHLLGSPDGQPHASASNSGSDTANHYATWRQGDSWAQYLPPTFPPTELASDASVAAFTDWLHDAAVHAPPSHTELPHITGPAHVVGEHGLAIADLPDWYRTLDDRRRANTPSPCRSSAPPPRPYVRRPGTNTRLRDAPPAPLPWCQARPVVSRRWCRASARPPDGRTRSPVRVALRRRSCHVRRPSSLSARTRGGSLARSQLRWLQIRPHRTRRDGCLPAHRYRRVAHTHLAGHRRHQRRFEIEALSRWRAYFPPRHSGLDDCRDPSVSARAPVYVPLHRRR